LKVLVIPFTPIGGITSHEWVGAAIQENLMTDVAGSPSVWALGLDHPIPNGDVAQATAQARSTGASLVVFGAYQFTESQLRITGQVLDVNANRVVATLKATGALVDLFKLEDTLSNQVQAVLPQQPNNLPAVSYGPDQSPAPVYASNPEPVPAPADASVAVAATPPVTTYVYSPTYDAPNYGYSYAYPTYSYPYYYGGFPIVIGGGYYHYHGPYYYHGFSGGFRPGFGFHGGGGFGFHGGFSGGGHGGFGHR
jgi:TolB-like protein